MGTRRQARECALQIIYQLDKSEAPTAADATAAVERFFENFDAPEDKARALAHTMVLGVVAERPTLDTVVSRHSPRWKLHRMAMVDRNILRLAAWELRHVEDTPPRVVIDEAVEIAKRFGAEQSGAFVNGVLDGVARELGRLPTKGPGGEDR
jgi:transcription antitermination protein NusB